MSFTGAESASASAGVCAAGEACLFCNSDNTGPKQNFKRGTGGNLNATLKNNNASQRYDFFDVCP